MLFFLGGGDILSLKRYKISGEIKIIEKIKSSTA